jgi:hypothetical protein
LSSDVREADRGIMAREGNGVSRRRPLDGVDPSRCRIKLAKELSEGDFASPGASGGLAVNSLDDLVDQTEFCLKIA